MPSRKIVGRGRVEQLKEHERRFLDILEPQIVGFPSGRLVQTEAPDFIVTALKRKIGIEVTKIQQQSGSNRSRRQESEQEKIANEAVRIFETQNSVALEVKIRFSANGEFNKRNRNYFATAIAILVNAYLPIEDGPRVLHNDWSDPEMFPYELDSIGIYRLASLKRNFWSVSSAGFVQEDFVAEMQAVISKKDALIPSYQSCSEYWLLIVSEGNSASTFFRPSRETLDHQYRSVFQRIFFLEAFTKKVSELKVLSLQIPTAHTASVLDKGP
ncbi:MAG: hypothetical protein AUH08_09070 [Verrucomicrobia bacterium 13_2_20CM_54_12]|jgi:hypothetical protein|nr:MAG: hypothetical protein AUH08_09070 [Verrucomicrobia bacterium 13_2_20CM_54_12]OLE10737.1 MAG: hypothetical protein AUG52_08965 [Verrucomicrobia bacterium 13_1_20CM_3_54_17]PYK14735.1 MAG: hypothetical protein DME64_09525 [Verrucomicrobiota bacterium]